MSSVDGQVVYILAGPVHAAAVLRRAMYSRCELRDRASLARAVLASASGPALGDAVEGPAAPEPEPVEPVPTVLPSVDERADDGDLTFPEEWI